MSLDVKCDMCETPLFDFGALVFGPPDKGVCDKWHVCRDCWEETIEPLLNGAKKVKNGRAAGTD